MKIIKVECLVIDNLYPYVVIQTDEGITGFGECFRRAPFVTKLYSSLPKTGRVVLGDITRNYSPNRLVPGKYLIRPVSSSKGEENPQKRSEGGTNSNSSNNNRTSILKVR